MPLKREFLYQRNGWYYANFHHDGKRFQLALDTEDEKVASARLQICMSMRISWKDYQKSISGYKSTPEVKIHNIGGVQMSPPTIIQTTRETTIALLEKAIAEGRAWRTPDGNWEYHYTDGEQAFPVAWKKTLENFQSEDQWDAIKSFYQSDVLASYKDKTTAFRFTRIWLDWLEKNKIKSWNAMTTDLLKKFEAYRACTPIDPRNGKQVKLPSVLVINRHLQFLSTSFDIAQEDGLLKKNPLKRWDYEIHHADDRISLAPDELQKVFADPVWDKTDTINPTTRETIPMGYCLRDAIFILFMSCKRRGEVLQTAKGQPLMIRDVWFDKGYAVYTEAKNKSKKNYGVRKAFHLSPFMADIIKRVIGARTDGPVFPLPSADYVTKLFPTVAERLTGKWATLHSMRHTATTI
jgi:integrase